MENDMLFFKFESILNASKSKEYKESARKKCTVLMNFLIAHNLLKTNPLNADGSIKDDLVLRANDFNDNGQLLFGKPVMNWFQYLDTGGDISNTSILEKGLSKIKAG